MRLTDSPFSDALAVLVTFSEVRVHRSGATEGEGEGEEAEGDGDGGGWETIPFPEGVTSITCDLKQLENGSVDLLGFGTLAAGHYTQIRLVVASASIHFENAAAGGPCAPDLDVVDDEGMPVRVPSGVVKLVRQFMVEEGGTTSILLDFDGDKSIRRTGPPASVATAAGGNGNGNGNAGGNGQGNGHGRPGGDETDEEVDGEEEGDDITTQNGPGSVGGRYLMNPVIRVVSVNVE